MKLLKLLTLMLLWPLTRFCHPTPWDVHMRGDGLWVHDANDEPVWFAGTGRIGLARAGHLVTAANLED